MKPKVAITLYASAATAALALAVTAISSHTVKNRAKEAEIRQAEKAKAMLEAKAAEDNRVAKEKELAAALAKKAALDADAELKEKTIESDRERQKTLEAERKIKDASAKEAADRRAAAEAQKKAAEENRVAAEAAERAAGENRLAKEAELRTAEAVKAAAAAKEAEATAILKAEELKEAEYRALCAEAKEIRDELRRREEETRPDRTLKDLIAENEADRSEELGISEEENRARLKAKDPEQIIGAKPITAADIAISSSESALEGMREREISERHAAIVRRFEAMIKAAHREGREEAVESLYANLVSLVPEYAASTNAPDAK